MLHLVTLEMSLTLKPKGIALKYCSLVDKVVSPGGLGYGVYTGIEKLSINKWMADDGS